jgi:hypothetical protein
LLRKFGFIRNQNNFNLKRKKMIKKFNILILGAILGQIDSDEVKAIKMKDLDKQISLM